MLPTMDAETLNCPMCGAAAATDATRCEHCGARLATVACPSCFGMVFVGAEFCSHCGAKTERTETGEAEAQLCPRCGIALTAVEVGQTSLRECPRCEGIWADTESLQRICTDREKQSAVLGLAALLPADALGNLETKIRYIPCPQCRTLMNRVNFANCSHVVVDVCRQHGTWFDKDELRRIVEFIRGGGLDLARQRERLAIEEQRRKLKAAQMAGAWEADLQPDRSDFEDRSLGISAAASVLRFLLG
jgi:Zn-finger nucleic acid-binding protein